MSQVQYAIGRTRSNKDILTTPFILVRYEGEKAVIRRREDDILRDLDPEFTVLASRLHPCN